MLHALAIKRIVARWSTTQKKPSHFSQAVVLASICMYCFCRFGTFGITDLDKASIEQFEYPELGMIRMDIASALLELDAVAQEDRLVPFVYNLSFQDLLAVLGSDNQSTISSELATRMKSAIDREQIKGLPEILLNITTSSNVRKSYSSQPQASSELSSFDVGAYETDLDPTGPKMSARLLGKKRKRSQINDDQAGSNGLRLIKPPSVRTTTEEPRYLGHHYLTRDEAKIKFLPDFPLCTACFQLAKVCTKLWGKRSCETCIELGVACKLRQRPTRQATLSSTLQKGQTNTPTADHPCRRCVQRGARCARSHGPLAPCDYCCKENRYCFADLKGVVRRHREKTS